MNSAFIDFTPKSSSSSKSTGLVHSERTAQELSVGRVVVTGMLASDDAFTMLSGSYARRTSPTESGVSECPRF